MKVDKGTQQRKLKSRPNHLHLLRDVNASLNLFKTLCISVTVGIQTIVMIS